MSTDKFESKPFVWVKNKNNEYQKMKLVVENCLSTNSLLFDLETDSLKIFEIKDIIFSEAEYNLIKSISEVT